MRMHETQRLDNARITRKQEGNMSNKRGKQHVLYGVATRGALGFQGLFGCVGI